MSIEFTKDVQKQVDNGELVPLMIVFYEPATERLITYSLGAIPMAEVKAMLQNFNFPRPSSDMSATDE